MDPSEQKPDDGPRRRERLTPIFPWIGVGTYVILLIATDIVARRVGLSKQQVTYLLAIVLAGVALLALFYFVRLTDAPPELKTLRILAVLLPSAFVFAIELILYFLEVDASISEWFEHIVGAAVLSAGAIPFSVYVFRNFSRLRDELSQRAQDLQTLHNTSMSVAEKSEPSELYVSIAQGARVVVRADRAALLYAPAGGDAGAEIVVPQGSTLAPSESELAREVVRRGSLRVAEIDGIPVIAAPVRRQSRAVGAVLVARGPGRAFTEEDELTLDMFAVAASAGLENASRLEEAQLLATIEERERIARDLHDDLGQLLAFLTMKIQAAQELSAQGRNEESREELARLEEATRALGAQVREAILGLRARVGPDRPLGAVLEEYLSDFGIQAGLEAVFDGERNAGARFPGPAQYQLLRIIQEALSNARRHAGASRVVVKLEEANGSLSLGVSDDGHGFDPSATASGGFGLKTMAERAASLGGRFEIRSDPGEGTLVVVDVPMERG